MESFENFDTLLSINKTYILPTYLAVQIYIGFVPILLEAVKEQNNMITEMGKRISELEGKLKR